MFAARCSIQEVEVGAARGEVFGDHLFQPVIGPAGIGIRRADFPSFPLGIPTVWLCPIVGFQQSPAEWLLPAVVLVFLKGGAMYEHLRCHVSNAQARRLPTSGALSFFSFFSFILPLRSDVDDGVEYRS